MRAAAPDDRVNPPDLRSALRRQNVQYVERGGVVVALKFDCDRVATGMDRAVESLPPTPTVEEVYFLWGDVSNTGVEACVGRFPNLRLIALIGNGFVSCDVVESLGQTGGTTKFLLRSDDPKWECLKARFGDRVTDASMLEERSRRWQ